MTMRLEESLCQPFSPPPKVTSLSSRQCLFPALNDVLLWLTLFFLNTLKKNLSYNEEEVTLEGLQEFSRRFFDGELKPYLKSEALADTDAAGVVKVVKGKSFESVVMDNGE